MGRMQANAMSEPARVVICDDSSTLRAVIQQVLSPEFTCRCYASAEEALVEAMATPPDLIISDLMMEGMDGFELCRRVRADPSLCQVPIVMLTSKADDESKAEGLESGADEYLYKPVRPRELRARARALVRLRRSTQDLQRRTAELEHANGHLTQARTALVQSEKLATLGTLVAGVAHEINNPLSFICSGAHSLNKCVDRFRESLEALARTSQGAAACAGEMSGDLTEATEIAQEILEGAQRLARITSDLKAFSSTQAPTQEDVDLKAEVERSWHMARLQGAAGTELVIDGELPHLRSQGRLIGQVLLNLFVNALHELRGKGTVQVRGAVEGDQVRLDVQDSGPGIRPEHLTRIFDPFFTTKPPGKGTGLGLSVSFGIMRGLGGSIEVESPPNQGALFRLRLPLRPASDGYTKLRLSADDGA